LWFTRLDLSRSVLSAARLLARRCIVIAAQVVEAVQVQLAPLLDPLRSTLVAVVNPMSSAKVRRQRLRVCTRRVLLPTVIGVACSLHAQRSSGRTACTF
jgi:hypothetical protein